jgi:hypothetical protein
MRLRTFANIGILQVIDPVWLWFTIRHEEIAARMMLSVNRHAGPRFRPDTPD